jgi:hypothetical protein
MRQLVWLISTIRRCGRITLSELSRKWVEDDVNEGSPLGRTSFNRRRDELFDLFGLVIGCDEHYQYYFVNPEVVGNHSIESWLLSTMTVNTALSESVAVRDRIVLEKVPSGEQFLAAILEAVKQRRRLLMGYRKFGAEPSERVVEPYMLKLSRRRWYMLARTEGVLKVFSLDRIFSLKPTGERFEKLADFSPSEYFAEYFGVLTDGTPLARVVIRAYGTTASYLRTLPLHDSQREVGGGEGYSDFELHLRPTADFIGELLSYDKGVEVMAPAELRLKIREKLEQMLKRY